MEQKDFKELLKEIYGGQTNALERAGRVITAWKAAAAVFGTAFLMVLIVLIYFLTHPFKVSVQGLPVRGVGGFGVNIVTKKQLAEFGKDSTYLLCNLDLANLPDKFDALETISTPSWTEQVKRMLPATTSKFNELDMSQSCSVDSSGISTQPLGSGNYLVKVPVDMVYWIKGRETKGKRFYKFTVKPCPATGQNPYGFCIESWEIDDVK